MITEITTALRLIFSKFVVPASNELIPLLVQIFNSTMVLLQFLLNAIWVTIYETAIILFALLVKSCSIFLKYGKAFLLWSAKFVVKIVEISPKYIKIHSPSSDEIYYFLKRSGFKILILFVVILILFKIIKFIFASKNSVTIQKFTLI